jgi:hypothetical protein
VIEFGEDSWDLLLTAGADQNPYAWNQEQIAQATKDAPGFVQPYAQQALGVVEDYTASIIPERIANAESRLTQTAQKQARRNAKMDLDYQNVSDTARYIGDLAYSTGRMAPSIALGIVGGGIGGFLGGGTVTAANIGSNLLSIGGMMTQVKADTMQQAITMGADYRTADAAGTLMAVVEAGTELLSGGIAAARPCRGFRDT